ncbi:hypothetical protein AAG570_003626 [Ranatra chinensis]|uniref:Uncharacterized protein n=1 Tax=Ranatra chinensis TaxID=642074 RepID=A0ABD0Y469_9HEMI
MLGPDGSLGVAKGRYFGGGASQWPAPKLSLPLGHADGQGALVRVPNWPGRSSGHSAQGALEDIAPKWSERPNGQGALLVRAPKWPGSPSGQGAQMAREPFWTGRPNGESAQIVREPFWSGRPNGQGALEDIAPKWSERPNGQGALLVRAPKWPGRSSGHSAQGGTRNPNGQATGINASQQKIPQHEVKIIHPYIQNEYTLGYKPERLSTDM